MRNAGLRILARGTCNPQSAWLNHGLTSLGHEIIETPEFRSGVDLLLVHDPAAISVQEVQQWRRSGVCAVLRAWNDPETFDRWNQIAGSYDFVLTTGLADMVGLYRDCGARALPLLPSGPPAPRAPQTNSKRDIDIIFAGRLDGAERRHRLQFLRRAARRWQVAVATDSGWPGAIPLEMGGLAELHRHARLAFHMDAITVNRFGVTRRCPSTRVFYGPAYGAVLLAELRPWLPQCYDPAEEMAGFADVDHALEVAAGLLEHPERLEAIALRAAQRSASEHTAQDRARQVASLATGRIPVEMSILALGPWYQQIELPGGVKTSLLAHSNTQRWERMRSFFPDVRGRRVLDLGMNSGFFSLQCIKLGARRVVGVDSSPLACAQARFIRDLFGATGMEIKQGDVTEAPLEEFDLCLMLALLHHFADIKPLLALATARASTLVMEWEVRSQPYFHPVEEVISDLESFGWRGEVKEHGHRPLIVATKSGS
jgi:2-polyprenyl-3-methyl-5-hydroxy-6-metoxy-1,4-benzoquinol methylase